MSDPQTQRFFMADDDGEPLEIVLYSQNPVELEPPETPVKANDSEDDEWESKGAADVAIASMQQVHKYIRFYTKYAIGAFKEFSAAEIEEMSVKFHLKIAGKTGLPMLTEGSGGADFEVSVKCKFPNKNKR
ncbi:MAG: hypothetical protein F6K16_18840 [Symploca sp. SIO2B6]|nr:hypothetical protein [Symploca sp. SIO2B6]